jgi:hypothetical protein
MPDYKVGFGKPPRHTQWKPGQSGNPGGRKTGSRGLKTDLAVELDAKHTIQINKQSVTGTRQQLMVRTLAIRAASGDLKAQQLLLATTLQVLGIEDRGGAKETLSAADRALLAELLGQAVIPENEIGEEPDSDPEDEEEA